MIPPVPVLSPIPPSKRSISRSRLPIFFPHLAYKMSRISTSRLDFKPHAASRQTYVGPSRHCYSTLMKNKQSERTWATRDVIMTVNTWKSYMCTEVEETNYIELISQLWNTTSVVFITARIVYIRRCHNVVPACTKSREQYLGYRKQNSGKE